MKDTYNVGYKTEDIKCIVVDFIAKDGKGGFPIMRQGVYVLCKDCQNWEDGYCTREGRHYQYDAESTDYLSFRMDADDFCSRGVKR